MTYLVSEDTAGNIAIDDLDAVAAAFAALMRRFDADPEEGVDLAEAAGSAAAARVIAQQFAYELCDAMATETADILQGYPALPADTVDRLDGELARLRIGWQSNAGPDAITVAKAFVRQAIRGDDPSEKDALSVRMVKLGEPLVQLECLKNVFAACCTLIVVAKGL